MGRQSASRLEQSMVLKTPIVYVVGVTLAHILTYYAAGALAVLGFGVSRYYPPSTEAISYLREIPPQYVIFPAQVVRGLLFAMAFYPFRRRIMQLGQVNGGLAVAGVVFLVGLVAAAGGLLEHAVFLIPTPLGFQVITFFEVLIYAILFGQFLLAWERRFNKRFYATSAPFDRIGIDR